ncbi:hypothetical protein BOTCAL_0555g00040 [Botryotinia calthae]|uniref:Uncharacterized protein n=1 Tax=Botryotinia calthae TaxID=38488 RepID=A0A4Y8CKN7_9HELO|nr:hypothetical protein BOTCAL_0555g00040 [Botryotinia calthae]
MSSTSYSWSNAAAIARKANRATGENKFSTLQTFLIALGVLIVFGILDNITPLWSVLGIKSRPEDSESIDFEEYTPIPATQQPLMTPAAPRRNPGGRGRKQAQNEESSMTPTTLRRSSRVRELMTKNGLPTPVSTPTISKRNTKAKAKFIKAAPPDDFFEPVSTPTGRKKVIKGREKQIILDEYEAFMNEPEEKKAKKASKNGFDYEGYSTPWTATQRKNVGKGKFGKVVKGKGKKQG